jgi:hypothetical protein
LNVLIADGLMIALSGGLLRYRSGALGPSGARALHRELMAGLFVIAVISYAARRILVRRARTASSRTVHGQEAAREARFYWSHVWPAIIAALAAPVGLVYGWWVDRSIQSIAPFWVVALALGSLALPRTSELEGFDSTESRSGPVPT